MKALSIAIMMALGAMLIATSCGGGNGPHPTPTTTPTSTHTATPMSSPTATAAGKTPTATFTTQIADCMEIYRIKYKGIKENEPDEYVTIRNRCDENLNLQGWVLKNTTNNSTPSFTFPFYILMAHTKVEVYTNELYQNSFRFNYPMPIWNNSVPDTAALYDAKGRLISTKSYEIAE